MRSPLSSSRLCFVTAVVCKALNCVRKCWVMTFIKFIINVVIFTVISKDSRLILKENYLHLKLFAQTLQMMTQSSFGWQICVLSFVIPMGVLIAEECITYSKCNISHCTVHAHRPVMHAIPLCLSPPLVSCLPWKKMVMYTSWASIKVTLNEQK